MMKISLREVEPGDLPLFFEHQRDPVAVALVAFRSRDRAAFDEHWAKLAADDNVLQRTIVVSAESAEESAKEKVGGHIASFDDFPSPASPAPAAPHSNSCSRR